MAVSNPNQLSQLGLPQEQALWLLLPLSIMMVVFNLWLLMLLVRRSDPQESRPPKSIWAAQAAPLFNEFLRSATKVLLYSLLFILPGIYQLLRLIWVPYVVVGHPDYPEKVDALNESIRISKGHLLGTLIAWGWLFAIDLTSTFTLPMLIDSRWSFLAALVVILTATIEVFSAVWLYQVFGRASGMKK